MKTAWVPIIREILLLILAVLIFLVLYDCQVKKKSLKDSLNERLVLLLLFRDGLGWIVYLIGIVVVVFLVYSIFFE